MTVVDQLKSLVSAAGLPTIAYGLVGVSAFVMLAAGPRALGPVDYSAMAIAWTLVTIFGLGVATPGEQTVTRGVAAGGHHQVLGHVRVRLLAISTLVIVVTVVAELMGWRPLGPASTMWLSAVAVAMIGWSLLVPSRGALLGHGDYVGYSQTLIVEASIRVALTVAALLFTQAGPYLLAGAISLPVVGAALASALRNRKHISHTVALPSNSGREQGAITIVALAGQVILSTAPLWIARSNPADAVAAGIFVSMATYMRIPTLIAGGMQAVVLSQASTLHSGGDMPGLRRITRHYLLLGLALGVGGVAFLLLFAPLGLRIFYGPELQPSVAVLGALGVGTCLFIVGVLGMQIFIGAQRASFVAVTWVIGAIVTTIALALLSQSLLGAAIATLIGITVPVVIQIVALPKIWRKVQEPVT